MGIVLLQSADAAGTAGEPTSDGGTAAADPADPASSGLAGGSSSSLAEDTPALAQLSRMASHSHSLLQDKPSCLGRVPWTVRIWLMALFLDIAYVPAQAFLRAPCLPRRC